MKRVVIESPFASLNEAQKKKYENYLEICIFDSLKRREAPFASHGFYTQWLKDSIPAEREAGMACGRAWTETAEIVAFYVDYGISPGMFEMLNWIFERIKDKAVFIPRPDIRRIPGWFDEGEREVQDYFKFHKGGKS